MVIKEGIVPSFLYNRRSKMYHYIWCDYDGSGFMPFGLNDKYTIYKVGYRENGRDHVKYETTNYDKALVEQAKLNINYRSELREQP